MPKLTIVRRYRPADHEPVVALWQLVFPDDPPHNEPSVLIRRKLAVQQDLFLVADVEHLLVGTVLAGYDGVRGWVYHLAVHPEFRRRGIGTDLMRSAEERLKPLGCPKLNLQVRAANANAVEFYRSLGYATEERISMGRLL